LIRNDAYNRTSGGPQSENILVKTMPISSCPKDFDQLTCRGHASGGSVRYPGQLTRGVLVGAPGMSTPMCTLSPARGLPKVKLF
jgi:hypothetical protein